MSRPRPRWFVLILPLAVLITTGAVIALRQGSVAPARTIESLYVETVSRYADLDYDEPVSVATRAWYRSPDYWRLETDLSDGRQSVEVSDGETVTKYDAISGTYHRQSTAEYWSQRPRLPNTLPFGFLQLGSGDVDAGVRDHRYGEGGRFAGTLLGLPVEVIVLGGNDAALWYWVHRETALILRYETRPAPGLIGASESEVTRLELNRDVDDARFRYTPPAAAREVEPPKLRTVGVWSAVQDTRRVPVPPGFPTPAYLPEGWGVSTTTVATAYAGPDVVAIEATIRLDPNSYDTIVMEQRRQTGGLNAALSQGSPVTVGNTTGFVRQEGGETILVLAHANFIVTLRSSLAPLAELVRIGASLDQGP